MSKQKIKEIFTKDFLFTFWYVMLVALFVYVTWFFDVGAYAMLVLGILAAFVLVISKDITPLIPIFFMLTQVISDAPATFNAYPIYISAAAIIIVAMVFNIIYYKQFSNYGKIKGFTVTVVFMGLSMILGGLTTFSERIPIAIGVVVIYGVLSVAFTFYFMKAMGKNNGEKASKVILYSILLSALIAIAQVITILLRSGDILGTIAGKKISTGYGNPNYLANIIARAVPILIYLSTGKKRFSCLYLVGALVCGVFIFMLSSRASLLCTFIMAIFVLIYFARKVERKIPWICTLVGMLVVAGIVVGVFWDKITDLFARMINMGFDSNGRFELYRIGWERFKQHPIFGVGLDYDIGSKFSFTPYWYHNTVIQAIACFGIVGLLALLGYLYWQYRIIIKTKYLPMKAVFFTLILMQFISMLDVFFYTPQEFVQMIIITVVAIQLLDEKETDSHLYSLCDMIKEKRKGKEENNV